MILGNINISPLPFYNDISLQNHRKAYAFGQVYPLITYANKLLPFQVVLNSSATTVLNAELHLFESSVYYDITSDLQNIGLSIKICEGYNILMFPGIVPLGRTLLEGRYYLAITLNTGIIYSEVFNIVNNVSHCVMVEYCSSENFVLPVGHVDFSNRFRFRCYIPPQIGKPEYIFEEEATERLGYSFIESQVSKKVFKFTFVAPEYLCDALRLIRLCDIKIIKEGSTIFEMSSFTMDPKWEELGDLASVECEFETNTVISSVARFAIEKSYDFNNDFNEDYS